MATKPRKKIGMMPCEGQRCESHTMGRMVTVYESDSGTLGYHCDICERSPYAKKGTGQYAEWVGDMVSLPQKGSEWGQAIEAVGQGAGGDARSDSAPRAGFSLGALK